MYRKVVDRNFLPTSQTLMVTGNLMILISGLFINGGAGGVMDPNVSPNKMVMNTVISSAASGLTHVILLIWRNETNS